MRLLASLLAVLAATTYCAAQTEPDQDKAWQTYTRFGTERNQFGRYNRVSFNQQPWDIEMKYNLDLKEVEWFNLGFIGYGVDLPSDTVSGWLVGCSIRYPERSSRLKSEYWRYSDEIAAEFYLQLKFRNIGTRDKRIPLRVLIPLATTTVFDKPLHWSVLTEDAEPVGSRRLGKIYVAPRVSAGYESSGRWWHAVGLSFSRSGFVANVMSDGFSLSYGTGLNAESSGSAPTAF